MILNDSSSFEEYDNLEMRSIFNCQNFINQKTMGFMGIILLNPTINYSHKSNGIYENYSVKSQLSILLLVKIPILKNSSILFLEQRGN